MVRLSMVKTGAAKPLSSSFTDRANPDSYPVRRRGTFSQNPRGNCQLAASSLARCYIQLFSPDLKFLTERPVRNRSGKTRGKQQHSGYWGGIGSYRGPVTVGLPPGQLGGFGFLGSLGFKSRKCLIPDPRSASWNEIGL
jgi:hypothetical protein